VINGKELPASQLITQPYEEISAQDWWVMFTASLALRGNFYGWIISRDRSRYPTQIMPVHPDNVRVRRLSDGTVEYRFNEQVVPIADVFHVRYMSVPGSLVGLSPIECMRNIIGGARAGDMYANAFFQNSATPSGVIELADSYDEGEAKALKQEWMGMHGGVGMSNSPAVLTEGAHFVPISITPDQAQFLESRQFSASTISGQIFRVPPHMIGIVDRTTSWGTGIEQQEMGYVRNTLIGYLSRGERALTAIHPKGQFVKFDLSERLRGDKLQRYTAYNLGRLGGWLNADEIRAEEDQAPLPDGQGKEYLVPINSELLTAAIEQAHQMVQAQNQPQGPQPTQTPASPAAKTPKSSAP
jgi:HK97 family phage portal protein